VWTNKYKENTDMYLNYINENTEEGKKNISIAALYEDFKTWFGTNNPGIVKPSNRDFKLGIEKHKTFKKVKYLGKCVVGIKNLKLTDEIYNDDSDNEEDE
jgi:hypothetical protein